MFTDLMASGSGGGEYVNIVLTDSILPYVIQNVTSGVFYITNSYYMSSNSTRIAIEDGVQKEYDKNAGDIVATYNSTTHTLTFSKGTSSYGGTHTLYGCYC